MIKAQRCQLCQSLLRVDLKTKSLACPQCDAIDPLKNADGWLKGELGRSRKDRERKLD